METKLNRSHTPSNQDIQDLLKELKDRNSEVQSVKCEREEIDLQIKQHRDEMDRRTLLLLYMDEGLMDALMELDNVKKEKQELDKKLHQLTTRSTKMRDVSLSELQKKEAALQEEENDLKKQREELKKTLEELQKIKPREPEPLEENQMRQKDTLDPTKTTIKPGRKKAARK